MVISELVFFFIVTGVCCSHPVLAQRIKSNFCSFKVLSEKHTKNCGKQINDDVKFKFSRYVIIHNECAYVLAQTSNVGGYNWKVTSIRILTLIAV